MPEFLDNPLIYCIPGKEKQDFPIGGKAMVYEFYPVIYGLVVTDPVPLGCAGCLRWSAELLGPYWSAPWPNRCQDLE